MESKRQQKFSRLIQKEIGEIFQADVKGLFSNAFITVTNVNVSPDLSIAKIYVSFLNSRNKTGLLEQIEEKNKTIRTLLSQRIGKQVRVIPELQFFLDDTFEYASKIASLFEGLDIPPADKDYKIDGDYPNNQ